MTTLCPIGYGLCRVGGIRDRRENYGKPHFPVDGVYAGKPRQSCLWCGKWLEPVKKHSFKSDRRGSTPHEKDS
jgi:hypothetical protein